MPLILPKKVACDHSMQIFIHNSVLLSRGRGEVGGGGGVGGSILWSLLVSNWYISNTLL